MDPREEEELRALVRRELEARQTLKSDAGGSRPGMDLPGISEERRRIVEEEISKFYRERGDYREFENEEGEKEWLTEDEIRERRLQIPVDMEELETGQQKVRNRVLILTLLSFAAIVMLFLLLRERTGSIQVLCNVPGALIMIDGSPTEYTTDFHFTGLPAGPHLISIHKPGYVVDGPSSVRVDLRPGRDEVVTFKMRLSAVDTQPEQAKPERSTKSESQRGR